MGIILVNKVVFIIDFSKKCFLQKGSPKLIFFNEKKIEKDSDDF